jgi:polyisoprenoid-binding protein YceI
METQDQAAAAATTDGPLPKGRWHVVPGRSRVGFKVKKFGLYFVKGKFSAVEGWIEVPDDPAATHGEVVVQAKTISTRMPPRDWHLRTRDFLGVKQYPELRITAHGIEPSEDGDFRLSATFEMHGERRSVTLGAHAHDHVLHLEGLVNRHDFGIRAPWHSEWIAAPEIHLDVKLGLERAS